MQRGITKRTQINPSWTDITTSMKTGNDGTECTEKQSWHTANQRIPWLRHLKPSSAALEASNAAEHTEHICSWPRPSLSKRFRRPTVGRVCSCLKSCARSSEWPSCLCIVAMETSPGIHVPTQPEHMPKEKQFRGHTQEAGGRMWAGSLLLRSVCIPALQSPADRCRKSAWVQLERVTTWHGRPRRSQAVNRP